jgi:aminoglycoside 3-N-acetyltransferase
MNMSLYTRIGTVVKRLFGIKDFSLLKKEIHKNVGKFFYHKKYTARDIISVMKELGVHKGSVVCIHSSMKEFYNYIGTAEELITEILSEIGSEGTLMMPAFPKYSLVNKENYVFDKDNDATGAGFLAETFRKYPGVIRSINVQHSVCAIGKYADYLTKDHHRTHDCWDKDSPWQRMIELDAIVIDLGMPNFYIGTFDHCVESILQYEHPYWAQFFSKKEEYKYYTSNRTIGTYTNYTSEIECRTRESNVTKHFDETRMQKRRISNLSIKAFYTKNCLNDMIDLGRKGIGIYYVPNPKKFTFC